MIAERLSREPLRVSTLGFFWPWHLRWRSGALRTCYSLFFLLLRFLFFARDGIHSGSIGRHAASRQGAGRLCGTLALGETTEKEVGAGKQGKAVQVQAHGHTLHPLQEQRWLFPLPCVVFMCDRQKLGTRTNDYRLARRLLRQSDVPRLLRLS